VTVGQAFHWFTADAALREIHRVLGSDGGLALIWNARDERDPLQAALSEIIDPLEGNTPRRKHGNWKTLLAESGLFQRSERFLFEHAQSLDEQGLVERVVSISFIASARADVRADVEERVRALARAVEQPMRLPYMTELYLGFAKRL
jgi:SAM-dependent methyltransferase